MVAIWFLSAADFLNNNLLSNHPIGKLYRGYFALPDRLFAEQRLFAELFQHGLCTFELFGRCTGFIDSDIQGCERYFPLMIICCCLLTIHYFATWNAHNEKTKYPAPSQLAMEPYLFNGMATALFTSEYQHHAFRLLYSTTSAFAPSSPYSQTSKCCSSAASP